MRLTGACVPVSFAAITCCFASVSMMSAHYFCVVGWNLVDLVVGNGLNGWVD